MGADLTSKADEYRAKARECEERAEQTRDPFLKQQMIDIAEKWRTMPLTKTNTGARPPQLAASVVVMRLEQRGAVVFTLVSMRKVPGVTTW